MAKCNDCRSQMQSQLHLYNRISNAKNWLPFYLLFTFFPQWNNYCYTQLATWRHYLSTVRVQYIIICVVWSPQLTSPQHLLKSFVIDYLVRCTCIILILLMHMWTCKCKCAVCKKEPVALSRTKQTNTMCWNRVCCLNQSHTIIAQLMECESVEWSVVCESNVCCAQCT